MCYQQSLELFDLKVIAKAPITSSCGHYIFKPEFFGARPNSGYKGRPMVFDLLFIKERKHILEQKSEVFLRKSVFTACIHGNFDHALDFTLRGRELDILSSQSFNKIKSAIINLNSKNLPLFKRIKERFKSKNYSLPIR